MLRHFTHSSVAEMIPAFSPQNSISPFLDSDLDTLYNPGFGLLDITSVNIYGGIPLLRSYNINTSDAAVLHAFLDFTRTFLSPGDTAVLVASDSRRLRAAVAEGLATLN